MNFRKHLKLCLAGILLITSLIMHPLDPDRGRSENEFYAAHQQALGGNPAGVAFEMKIADHPQPFKAGEVISLDLIVSCENNSPFSIGDQDWDRSGRLWQYKFIVKEKSQAYDPLAGLINFGLGGAGIVEDCKGEPYRRRLDLNEWVYFRNPGKYSLYLSASILDQRDETKGKNVIAVHTIVSNILSIEIVSPTTEWQENELNRGIELVSNGGSCQTIRYLNTREAALFMLNYKDLINGKCGLDFYFGLQAFPGLESLYLVILKMREKTQNPWLYFHYESMVHDARRANGIDCMTALQALEKNMNAMTACPDTRIPPPVRLLSYSPAKKVTDYFAYPSLALPTDSWGCPAQDTALPNNIDGDIQTMFPQTPLSVGGGFPR